ncbi:MAG: metal ABC transporter substrate-binding protein [Candidatus Anstonellaceae archaeon]
MKALVLIAILALAGCTTMPQSESQKLNVVVTTYFLEEFAKEVGKDKVEVRSILPGGANPHAFEPSPLEMATIQSADIFIYNGAGLEPYVGKIRFENATVVEASAKLNLEKDEEHGGYDPHVWLDPTMAAKQVEVIAEAFSKADPSNSDFYRQNADKYISELLELDREIENEVKKFKKKGYIGFHPSFTYFNKRYGLEYYAVIEEFAGDEPSARELAKLIEIAREKNVGAIFAEPFLDSRSAQVIAKEIGAEVLYLDTMHSKTNLSKGYIQTMRYNLQQLGKELR